MYISVGVHQVSEVSGIFIILLTAIIVCGLFLLRRRSIRCDRVHHPLIQICFHLLARPHPERFESI